MKLLQKLTAIIILFSMLITLNSPIISYAEGEVDTNSTEGVTTEEQTEEVETKYEIKETEEWDVSKNGDRSVIAKWTLNNRTVTISGSGDMKDWDEKSNGDWHNEKYRSIVNKVEIKSGITNIGRYAFYNLSDVTKISIPSSIKIIDFNSFHECRSLISVTIPKNTTSIGGNAFIGCTSLEKITVDANNAYYLSINDALYDKDKTKLISYPAGKKDTSFSIASGVDTIGQYAFYKSKNLKSITIPSSVKTLENCVFYGCSSLTKATIPNSVSIIDVCSFENCTSLTKVVLSSNIKEIPAGTFESCSKLTDVEIPSGVKVIGNEAFRDCISLTNLTIPSSVTKMGEGVFEFCDKLTSMNIPSNVTSIGERTFRCCTNLNSVKISGSIKKIEENLFSECINLTSITMPNSVTSIEDRAFEGCQSLKSIKIPSNVKTIGYDAFDYCIMLENITLSNTVTSIGETAFEDCIGPIMCYTNSYAHKYAEQNKLAYVLLDNVTSSITTNYQIVENDSWDISKNNDSSIIARWSLEGKTIIISGNGEMRNWEYDSEGDWHNTKYTKIIKKIIIEEGITNIGEKAFYNCMGLTNITIPESVTSIGKSAFYNCENLTKVAIPSSVNKIEENTFFGCSKLSSITISNEVKNIGYNAFNACWNLTSIILPNDLTNIGDNAFYKCINLESINISENNANFCTLDGVLFNKDKTVLIHYPAKKEETVYDIPNSVTKIEKYAFYGCSNLTNIEIPNSVTSIEEKAFQGCSRLKTIVIPDGVTELKVCLFEGCTDLENITIPSSVTSIETSAFNKCENLKTVNIPQGVTRIKETTFSRCFNLEKVTLPNTITSIDKYAFLHCQSLTSIEIPNSVTSIESDAFLGCTNLKNVMISQGITSIKDSTFYRCINLKDIIIPANVANIENDAFKECKGPVICKKNSAAHKALETKKIAYVLDNNRPIVIFTPNGNESSIKSVKTQVEVRDNYGVNEESLKYLWSQKEEISPEEITEKFTNSDEIASPEKMEGTVYLYIYAKDLAGSYRVTKSNAFNIDDLGPQLNIQTNPEGKTKENVTVTITSHEKVQEVEGWVLSDDKLQLTKEFEENEAEEIIVKDLLGNETKANIKVTNIDRAPAEIEVGYSKTNPTNQNIIVTMTGNEKLQQLEGWTLSEDELRLTKEYNQNKSEEITVKDLAGNETKANINISNIDKVVPVVGVAYSNKELTKENVTVTITANEEIQGITGWTLSNDKKTLTKTYQNNIEETIQVKDLAGNTADKNISIINIDKTKPEIAGVENANSYNDSVIITATDANLGTLLLEKDGEKVEGYTNGKEIIEEGTYKLTAVDKLGNTTIVNFTIKYVRGDLNKDRKIDMQDVLTILKHISQEKKTSVANKHPEWKLSEKGKIVSDTDRNGKVEMLDVLKILQYIAAKTKERTAQKHPEWLNLN